MFHDIQDTPSNKCYKFNSSALFIVMLQTHVHLSCYSLFYCFLFFSSAPFFICYKSKFVLFLIGFAYYAFLASQMHRFSCGFCTPACWCKYTKNLSTQFELRRKLRFIFITTVSLLFFYWLSWLCVGPFMLVYLPVSNSFWMECSNWSLQIQFRTISRTLGQQCWSRNSFN